MCVRHPSSIDVLRSYFSINCSISYGVHAMFAVYKNLLRSTPVFYADMRVRDFVLKCLQYVRFPTHGTFLSYEMSAQMPLKVLSVTVVSLLLIVILKAYFSKPSGLIKYTKLIKNRKFSKQYF